MVQRLRKLLVNGHEVCMQVFMLIKNVESFDHFCYEIIQPRCVLITILWVSAMIAIIRIKIQSRINSHFPKITFISFSTTSSYLKTACRMLHNSVTKVKLATWSVLVRVSLDYRNFNA